MICRPDRAGFGVDAVGKIGITVHFLSRKIISLRMS